MNNEQLEFLTPMEVAAVLRVSAATIRRRCAAGEIACTKIGRQYRICANVLQAARPLLYSQVTEPMGKP